MRYQRGKFTAELRYAATYLLEEAEPREIGAYGRGQKYLPEILVIELYSNAYDGAPDPSGLSVTRVTSTGSKVKKDGTPGAATWREVFSSIRSLPPEFRAIADGLLLELIRGTG